MAKIVIAGEAVVVTSDLKLEDYRKIAKYRPRALTLYGGEDGKEPIFCAGVAAQAPGSISEYGVEFGGATHDGEKLATVTLVYTGAGEDIKSAVAEDIGSAVILLNRLEATLPDVIAEIDAEKAAILDSITLA